MSNPVTKVLQDQRDFLRRALESAKATEERARADAVEAKTRSRDAAEIVVNIRAALQAVEKDLDTGRLN